MEMLLTFVLTLLVLLGLLFALKFGRTPTYRPERKQVLQMLELLAEGHLSQQQWDLFIGMPIQHDPELELIRLDCYLIQEGDDEHPPAAEGLGDYLFDRAARARFAEVEEKLRVMIKTQPIVREF